MDNYTHSLKHYNQTILCIFRSGTRRLTNLLKLSASLHSELSPLREEIFWGNESLKETITKFSRAAIVIGFHGAGLVNVYFCRPKTIVVEVSILKPSITDIITLEAQHLWRSNVVVGVLHANVHWMTFALTVPPEYWKAEEVTGFFFQNQALNFTLSYTEFDRLRKGVVYKYRTLNETGTEYGWEILSERHHSKVEQTMMRSKSMQLDTGYHRFNRSMEGEEEAGDDEDDEGNSTLSMTSLRNSSQLRDRI